MALGFGFNKAKVLASAEKFVQQGKLQNAIAEYEKVVREDPKDLTVLNTIGDLYARIGDNSHAVHYFKKVGDQYAQNGFTVKAIAIYKKLSKLAPGNTEHITKLAELFTQQGLFNDARAQYMLMADAHLRAGEHNQASRVMQRILELEPENTNTQAKLADLYLKLGKKDEALKIYMSAAEALNARASYDHAAEALGKVLTLDPTNAKALHLRGMIAANSGDSLAAVHALEQLPDLESQPEALRALLRAQLLSGRVEDSESIAQKLLAHHNDPAGVSSLAEWYLNQGRLGSALRLYEANADLLFAGGEKALQDTLYPLINKVKDNPEALDTMLRLLQRAGDTSHTAEVMELQAHACALKGEYALARDLYRKLSELEPENALHGQNHRQMLAKLGEDSATRILTPEEAAQAFMVEELDEGSPVVQQKYDPPTETAIEAALTDAELFVSYNVPSKAIAPLEAALPLAPKDVALNQRLATLYARAERWGDAARVCQNLSEIYRELGHAKESAKYLEASRKYGLRANAGATPAPSRTAEPPTPQPAAPISPVIEVGPDTAPSVQEFTFDVPDHLATEPEPVMNIPEKLAEPAPVQDFQITPVATESAAVADSTLPEADVSSEWEDMLSVEAEEIGVESQETIQLASAMIEPDRVPAQPETQGGSDVCYLVDDKVQEIQFYISQKMWQAANNGLLELSEMAPEAPQLPELTAAIAAAQRSPAAQPQASEPVAATPLQQGAADFLPPPFAAPAPQPNIPTIAEPRPAELAAHHVPILSDEPVLELEEEASQSAAAANPMTPAQRATSAPANSTEDILTDFVHQMETTELADFVPRQQPESAPGMQMSAPSHASAAVPAQQKNGVTPDNDQSSILNDILSDLQEETGEIPEPEEDPETHYNLGIAFKEMGLLDEAIGELQKVCRAIDRGHSFSQPIQAYTWLAQCLVDKGAPEAAVRWYQKALQISGLDDSSRCAIYYDLAAAYEAFGDKKSALANFMEVYGSNIDFRDVASRIKVLKS
jgi:tetratricopeptide (TPR) repeat protein